MPPERKRRAQSFFGLHFDFHADDRAGIGAGLTEAAIDAVLARVRPDYVQCDCKGHWGLASYPTRVGTPAPGLAGDPLRTWRAATARRGVALYVHYSGLFDKIACSRGPGWARTRPDGTLDTENASTIGPYARDLLVPQLDEVIKWYAVDGIWVDGDNWAAYSDCSDEGLAAFARASGIQLTRDRVPQAPGDPHWFVFMEFWRERFREYVRGYVTELHRRHPGVQITSNHACSAIMPEAPAIDLDYLSADYYHKNSVNIARLEARVLAGQGRPWDLMPWGHSGPPLGEEGAHSTKSAVQVQQEAAHVIAQGGGIQCYFPQKPDGSLALWQAGLMERLARFCRLRERHCFRSRTVPQVALLHSTFDYYRRTGALFMGVDRFGHWYGELLRVHGALAALLDNQLSVDVLVEKRLEPRLAEYPVVVLPECRFIDPEFRRSLLRHVRAGAALLCLGPDSAAHFADELRLRGLGAPEPAERWLEYGGHLAGLTTNVQAAPLDEGEAPLGRLFAQNDPVGDASAAASVVPCGAGAIAAIHFDLAEPYVHARTAVLRDFTGAAVRRLFPEPLVEVQGSHAVDVVTRRTGEVLRVHLLSTAGPHADPQIHAFDELPPLGPLTVSIRLPSAPARVSLDPQGDELPFVYGAGRLTVTVPRLTVHAIVSVD